MSARPPLFVKICGLTRAQDAEAAVELGADALGFVFWPGSPRYVAPDAARDIVVRVPALVMKVGVFVDAAIDEVVRVFEQAGLSAAQLHGQESPEYCRELMVRLPAVARSMPGASRTVIKAVALADNSPVDISAFGPDVLLLVDAHDPVRHGGTGRPVSWESARGIAAQRPTILAGGLNAANVKLAVRSVRPFGVDVSSGVESAPGVKDPDRLRSFFEALHD